MTELKRDVATWSRWLHIYLSMISFAAVLFFSFTGITLNHSEWLESHQTVSEVEGTVPQTALGDSSNANQLMMVEYFRDHHHVRASLKSFEVDDSEYVVSFKGPGYSADAFVDRETGAYQMTITESGIFALMNDLHKGRDSGGAWSWFIDVSAVLMILVSLSGFLMIFFLKKRKVSGLVLSLVGLLVGALLFWLFV